MTGRVLYRVADGRSATLRRNVSILVEEHRVAWIRPAGGEEDTGGATVVDCAGATTTLERFATDDGRARIAARREQAEASIRVARDAGVAIATGSDFGGGSLRANQLAWEVTSLVAAGIEPVDALAAATWRGGELIGEPEAGVLRDGGPADFFLVHGDPLSDPEALWRVWRAAWGVGRLARPARLASLEGCLAGTCAGSARRAPAPESVGAR